MSSLRESIPRPASQSNAIRKPEAQAPCTTRVPSKVPRYGKRLGFLPRSAAHFQDGGSYPEVHVAQYPPGLGVANSTNASEIGLASVTASAGGDASYDSIIALGAGQNKVLHANHDDVLPKPSRVSVFPANSRIISHLITHGGCVMCDRRSLSDRPRSTPLLSLRGPRRRCLGVWKKVWNRSGESSAGYKGAPRIHQVHTIQAERGAQFRRIASSHQNASGGKRSTGATKVPSQKGMDSG